MIVKAGLRVDRWRCGKVGRWDQLDSLEEYRGQDTNTQEELDTSTHLLSCLGEEHHPGGQDEGAGDGGWGLDEGGQVEGWGAAC